MRWLNKGLYLFIIMLTLCSCTQDKNLPTGIRVSAFDTNESLNFANANIENISEAKSISSWPQAGLNPEHNIGNIASSLQLKLKLEKSIGKGIDGRNLNIASPVVFDNLIYTMDAKALINATDTQGNSIWKNNLIELFNDFKDTKNRAAGLAVNENSLYATTAFGGIIAFNNKTGETKWQKIIDSPIRIAPVIADNFLLIQTVDNKIFAYNNNTGEELWKFSVASENTTFNSGAVPTYCKEDNVVIAGFSNGEIVVINANTGTPLWSSMLISNKNNKSSTNINSIVSYPIIEDGVIYAIGNDNLMVALDIQNGEQIWQNEIGALQNMLLVGDYIFVMANNNYLYAVNKLTGEVMWDTNIRNFITEENKIIAYANSPIMINNYILLTLSNGLVLKINATNGKVVAQMNLQNSISNMPIVANQNIYIISDNAKLMIFE